MDAPTASGIITNHNYGRFLPQAIESALSQTHPRSEVVVVDDGSTDDSREVIAKYGDRVVSVLKGNGGQASAFNAGFAASRGDVVMFLDADDVLLPEAAERATAALDGAASKVQWPLWTIDAEGRRTGEVKGVDLPAGDLRATVARLGPSSALPSAPTSGNAWRRSFLDEVLPMPEDDFHVGADSYLFTLAPAFGPVARVDEPQALFRLHGENAYQCRTFEE